MGTEENNDGGEETQRRFPCLGVGPPTAVGSNAEDDFRHAFFFLVLSSFQWDLLKLPICYPCF